MHGYHITVMMTLYLEYRDEKVGQRVPWQQLCPKCLLNDRQVGCVYYFGLPSWNSSVMILIILHLKSGNGRSCRQGFNTNCLGYLPNNKGIKIALSSDHSFCHCCLQ